MSCCWCCCWRRLVSCREDDDNYSLQDALYCLWPCVEDPPLVASFLLQVNLFCSFFLVRFFLSLLMLLRSRSPVSSFSFFAFLPCVFVSLSFSYSFNEDSSASSSSSSFLYLSLPSFFVFTLPLFSRRLFLSNEMEKKTFFPLPLNPFNSANKSSPSSACLPCSDCRAFKQLLSWKAWIELELNSGKSLLCA